MDVMDPKGVDALASAKIKCPDKNVLTGFKIEGNTHSTKFRYFLLYNHIRDTQKCPLYYQ
jgi:hypothetical protein